MALTKRLTLKHFLIVFTKTVFFRNLSAYFRQKKSLAMTNCKKNVVYVEKKVVYNVYNDNDKLQKNVIYKPHFSCSSSLPMISSDESWPKDFLRKQSL